MRHLSEFESRQDMRTKTTIMNLTTKPHLFLRDVGLAQCVTRQLTARTREENSEHDTLQRAHLWRGTLIRRNPSDHTTFFLEWQR